MACLHGGKVLVLIQNIQLGILIITNDVSHGYIGILLSCGHPHKSLYRSLYRTNAQLAKAQNDLLHAVLHALKLVSDTTGTLKLHCHYSCTLQGRQQYALQAAANGSAIAAVQRLTGTGSVVFVIRVILISHFSIINIQHIKTPLG